jgi:hypothetical protein
MTGALGEPCTLQRCVHIHAAAWLATAVQYGCAAGQEPAQGQLLLNVQQDHGPCIGRKAAAGVHMAVSKVGYPCWLLGHPSSLNVQNCLLSCVYSATCVHMRVLG